VKRKWRRGRKRSGYNCRRKLIVVPKEEQLRRIFQDIKKMVKME
jgi:hypothetical protein